VQSLETGQRKTVVEGGTNPMYVDGAVIVSRAGTLLAIPFDLDRLEATGPPIPVVERIADHANTGSAQYAVSRNGSVVYIPGGATVDGEAVWVDREGKTTPVKDLRRPLDTLAISPDGQRAAVRIFPGGDIWIYDFPRASLARLTFAPGADTSPVWTPDGRRIIFAGIRTGPFNIFWKPADGTGNEDLLLDSMDSDLPTSVSPDGRWLLFTRQAMQTGNDLWLLPLQGDRTPRAFVVTPFAEAVARFSPDGRWVAYQSNETGRFEVYVVPFPGPGGKWQVSTEGGERPVWARNGRELFYRDGERVMVVAVEDGPTFVAGQPRALFQGPFETVPQGGLGGITYDVAPDGKRFLMIKRAEEMTDRHIYWLTGWSSELRAQLAKSAR
jgi:Tol biopolymer transport system component